MMPDTRKKNLQILKRKKIRIDINIDIIHIYNIDINSIAFGLTHGLYNQNSKKDCIVNIVVYFTRVIIVLRKKNSYVFLPLKNFKYLRNTSRKSAFTTKCQNITTIKCQLINARI